MEQRISLRCTGTLVSRGFSGDSTSRSQAEHLRIVWILPFDDEFRDVVGLSGIQEKIGKPLAQCIRYDELGRRNTRADGSQP